MSGWKAKRFWTEASVVAAPKGFTVHLDGRPVKTPAKTALIVPSRALAEAIRDEWQAQDDEIRPHTMPVTRSANSALDKVATQRAEVAALIAEYGATDLLCYRAKTPDELVVRQAEAWDPLLDWAAVELDAPLQVTAGVMHRDQPEAALAALADRVAGFSDFGLAALHDLVGITGSLVLGLAVTRGRLDAAAAWDLSRIDEEWQIAQWGEDAEARETAQIRRAALLDAARFWQLLNRG